MSIESVMPSNHLILCHTLLLPPSIFLSIRVFSNESVPHIRWQKYWSFSFSISPSNEYSGLISFRMDWLDLLNVQGTLKSLLQHHGSKAQVVVDNRHLFSQTKPWKAPTWGHEPLDDRLYSQRQIDFIRLLLFSAGIMSTEPPSPIPSWNTYW